MTAAKQSKNESAPQPKPVNAAERLAHEVSSVADEMKKQNNPWRRLLMGILFGAGTAIGASVVATLVIVILMQTLEAVGLGEYVEQAGLPAAVESIEE